MDCCPRLVVVDIDARTLGVEELRLERQTAPGYGILIGDCCKAGDSRIATSRAYSDSAGGNRQIGSRTVFAGSGIHEVDEIRDYPKGEKYEQNLNGVGVLDIRKVRLQLVAMRALSCVSVNLLTAGYAWLRVQWHGLGHDGA